MGDAPTGKFVTDGQSNRVAVLVEIEEDERMLDELDELAAIRAYDAAKLSGDEAVPFARVVEDIEKKDA